jgi:non-lysosomal glucosylceramidase
LYRPPWLVSALFNELYYLVDGGTLWGRPLTVAGLYSC